MEDHRAPISRSNSRSTVTRAPARDTNHHLPARIIDSLPKSQEVCAADFGLTGEVSGPQIVIEDEMVSIMRASMPPRKTGPKLPEAIQFGKRIRQLREAKGWSQELLAEESGLNSVQISHIENGRNEPKLRTILWLAKAFRMAASELIKPFR